MWAGRDLHPRRQSHRVYSAAPLATWVPTHWNVKNQIQISKSKYCGAQTKPLYLFLAKKQAILKFPDKICDRKKCQELFLMRFYKKINFVKFKTPLRVLWFPLWLKNCLKLSWTFENRFIRDEPVSVLKLREEFSSLN